MRPATTIVKVCRVMDQFQDRQPLGITDLARRTGLLPSDVHRIVRSLLVAHYLDQAACAVDFPHAARTDQREDLIGSESHAVLQDHYSIPSGESTAVTAWQRNICDEQVHRFPVQICIPGRAVDRHAMGSEQALVATEIALAVVSLSTTVKVEPIAPGAIAVVPFSESPSVFDPPQAARLMAW
jgi:hypothetical protein